MRIRSIVVILAVLLLVAPPSATAKTKIRKIKPPSGRIMIIYSGPAKGADQAEKIKVYLRHFKKEADIIPASQYTPGIIGSYRWIFYLGATSERLSPALKNDLLSTKKTVVWVNDNLDQLDRRKLARKGLVYRKKAPSKIAYYKNIFLPKTDRSINVVRVTDKSQNIIFSWAYINRYKKTPYIVQANNFWYVADNPLEKAKEATVYLAFTDILHNVIEDHPAARRIIVRIDGISPKSEPNRLQTIVDSLYFNRVPFALSVTPVYKKSLTAPPIYLHRKPALVSVLKDARKKGGVLVLNGYTNQSKKETGHDAEFGWTDQKAALRTESRIKKAITELKRAGLEAKIWQVPYYKATPADYRVFRKYFRYVFDRGTEPPSPYVIDDSLYHQKILPENLGYVTAGAPNKEDIPERAWRMQVVRDAHAGFAIQETLPIRNLIKIIERLKSLNYDFVSPYEALGLKLKQARQPFFMDYTLYRVSFQTELILQSIGWAILPGVFFSYYLIIFGLSRRIKPKPKRENNRLFFIFVVPALNEAKVIRSTLTKLCSLPQKNYLVLAVNDNSDDATAEEIGKVSSDKLRLMSLKAPYCRQGKGNVLNRAFRFILDDSGLTKKYAPENIIFSVIDSDGAIDPEILPSVAPYFDEPTAAAVQTPVRIENCDKNLLTRWQDFEFRVFTFLFQSAREQLGSVGLGGNGQFIRVSALRQLGEKPWTACLTEDLDIGIRLILDGHRNHFCSTSYVCQQGVPQFWPLIKQRTRWFQGHIQCWRHLGRIALHPKLPVLAKVDITYYLLSISLALVIVPANFVMAFQAGYLAVNPQLSRLLLALFGGEIFFYWYFVYFGAMPIFTYSYWRSKPQRFISAVVLSHLFLFVSVVWLIAGYWAIFRLFRQTTNWHKTIRYLEPREEPNQS